MRLARLVSTLALTFAGVAAPSTTQTHISAVFEADDFGTSIPIRLSLGR